MKSGGVLRIIHLHARGTSLVKAVKFVAWCDDFTGRRGRVSLDKYAGA